MAQIISILDSKIISFITGGVERYATHDDLCTILSNHFDALQEAMREDDYDTLAYYTEGEFTAAFKRIKMANWPLLTTRSFAYAVGEDRIFLPHEITEEQRVRLAGCWIVQEQDAFEAKVKTEAYLRGAPLPRLLEMPLEDAIPLASNDATSKWSVPTVEHAANELSVCPTAITDFLQKPHPELRLWDESLISIAKLGFETSSPAKVIPFPKHQASA